jgi:hypothetical protein
MVEQLMMSVNAVLDISAKKEPQRPTPMSDAKTVQVLPPILQLLVSRDSVLRVSSAPEELTFLKSAQLVNSLNLGE